MFSPSHRLQLLHKLQILIIFLSRKAPFSVFNGMEQIQPSSFLFGFRVFFAFCFLLFLQLSHVNVLWITPNISQCIGFYLEISMYLSFNSMEWLLYRSSFECQSMVDRPIYAQRFPLYGVRESAPSFFFLKNVYFCCLPASRIHCTSKRGKKR